MPTSLEKAETVIRIDERAAARRAPIAVSAACSSSPTGCAGPSLSPSPASSQPGDTFSACASLRKVLSVGSLCSLKMSRTAVWPSPAFSASGLAAMSCSAMHCSRRRTNPAGADGRWRGFFMPDCASSATFLSPCDSNHLTVWFSPHTVSSMTTEQILLAEIDAFLADTGMSETTLGRRAMSHWKFVATLRAGRRCWPETIAKVRAFIADEQRRRGEKGRAKA